MNVPLEGKPHYILNATCDSRLGTVAAVSGFLASSARWSISVHSAMVAAELEITKSAAAVTIRKHLSLFTGPIE